MRKWMIVLAVFTVAATIGSQSAGAQTTDPQWLFIGNVDITTAVGGGNRLDPSAGTGWNGTTGNWDLFQTDAAGNETLFAHHTASTNTIFATNGNTPGLVSISGSIGVWSVNLDAGTGSPVLTAGSEDLNVQNASASAAGTLFVAYSQNGLLTPFPAWNSAFAGTIAGSATVRGFADEGHGTFSLANGLGTMGPFSTSPFAATGTGTGDGLTPYSLNEYVTITGATGNVDVSGDLSLIPAATPEPSSILLFGTGLLGLGGILRRRLRLV